MHAIPSHLLNPLYCFSYIGTLGRRFIFKTSLETFFFFFATFCPVLLRRVPGQHLRGEPFFAHVRRSGRCQLLLELSLLLLLLLTLLLLTWLPLTVVFDTAAAIVVAFVAVFVAVPVAAAAAAAEVAAGLPLPLLLALDFQI